jgi:hypothetical protein
MENVSVIITNSTFQNNRVGVWCARWVVWWVGTEMLTPALSMGIPASPSCGAPVLVAPVLFSRISAGGDGGGLSVIAQADAAGAERTVMTVSGVAALRNAAGIRWAETQLWDASRSLMSSCCHAHPQTAVCLC